MQTKRLQNLLSRHGYSRLCGPMNALIFIIYPQDWHFLIINIAVNNNKKNEEKKNWESRIVGQSVHIENYFWIENCCNFLAKNILKCVCAHLRHNLFLGWWLARLNALMIILTWHNARILYTFQNVQRVSCQRYFRFWKTFCRLRRQNLLPRRRKCVEVKKKTPRHFRITADMPMIYISPIFTHALAQAENHTLPIGWIRHSNITLIYKPHIKDIHKQTKKEFNFVI